MHGLEHIELNVLIFQSTHPVGTYKLLVFSNVIQPTFDAGDISMLHILTDSFFAFIIMPWKLIQKFR